MCAQIIPKTGGRNLTKARDLQAFVAAWYTRWDASQTACPVLNSSPLASTSPARIAPRAM